MKLVVGPDDLQRAVTRMAHEIVERNGGTDGIVVVGVQRGGGWLADRLGEALSRIGGTTHKGTPVPVGRIDASMFRDDIGLRRVTPATTTDLPVDVDGATVVLVDDVLYTGRTVRAALDALAEYGRPAAVQLAVAVDRGHRELPIRADYVGKNLPTSRAETVEVTPEGVRLG